MVTDWNQLAQGAFEALPGVKGNRADFAAVLAKQADEGVSDADLLLAWATLKKDPVATRELDRRLVQAVRMTVGRFDTLNADDVEQLVRQRVLVGDGVSGPKLLKYRGKGALKAWLKAVATTLAIDESRKGQPDKHGDDDVLANTASGETGAESKLLHQQQKHHFNAAFRQALTQLTPQDRTVLRMRFVDGLTAEEIGKAFNVHRTTATRWLEKVQKDVMEATHALLAANAGLATSEIRSILRAVQPSLSDRISRLLARS